MAKYRKKTLTEINPYEVGMEDGFECFDIGGIECRNKNRCILPEGYYKKLNPSQCDNRVPYINTLEGKYYISPGDYIAIGIKGERYPIKPDILAETYEIVK